MFWLGIAGLALVMIAFGYWVVVLATVLHVGKERWDEANEISGPPMKAFMGEVETTPGGVRDIRVSKGLVWDKKKDRWVRQGKLSDEYIQDLIF